MPKQPSFRCSLVVVLVVFSLVAMLMLVSTSCKAINGKVPRSVRPSV